MISLQTFLALGLLIWTLPTNTFARPCHTTPTSTALFCAGHYSHPSARSYYIPNLPTTPVLNDDDVENYLPDYPDPPASDRNSGPHVPEPIIILFPAIVGFSIMGGLWLCFRKRKPSRSETVTRVPRNTANIEMGCLDGQPRPGAGQSQPPLGRESGEVGEAPPPYSREPP